MKVLYQIFKTALAVVFIGLVAISCEKSAPLSIDPIVIEAPFTFTPTHGSAGTAVTITGSGLNDVQKVSFGNTNGVILQKNNTEIKAEVPVGSISGKIKLVKAGSVITSVDVFTVDVTPVPTITEFSPAIAGSGEVITITGTLLERVDSVYIGSLKAEMQSKEATTITILTPTGLKTGLIRMFYNYMTSYGMQKVAESVSASNLSLALPVIISITPDITALDIGMELTITGTMLDVVTKVQFATTDAVFTINSPTELKTTVPVGATTGKITLTVPDGTVQSGTYQVNLPTVTSFTPAKGASQEGERILSIIGTRFSLVESVLVGPTAATIETSTETVLTITVAGTAAGKIGLVTKNGTVSSSLPFLLTGDFWVADFDNVYSPIRLQRTALDQWTENSINEAAEGGPTGKYAKYTGKANGSLAKIYWFGNGTGEDLFYLFTNDPNKVFFSFDISYSQLPANYINADGSVDIQVFSFTSGDRNPYGFSKIVKVPFTGAENWQNVRVELKDLIEDGNLHDGTTPASHTSKRVKPNKMRIMSLTFAGSFNATGEVMVINVDNIKFTIE